RRTKKHGPLVSQALERRKAAIVRAVTVCPIVITGRERRRRFQRIQITHGLDVKSIVTWAVRSLLEIAVMHGKCQLLTVHIRDEVWYSDGCLNVGVRKIAPQSN